MSGLAAASPDMYEAADRYIKEYNLFDIDVKYPLGLSQDDLEKVSGIDKIDAVQGARVFDMVLDQNEGSDFTSRVYGILDSNSETVLNQFNLIEGRLPENPGECVAESIFGKYAGEIISIGDTLTLDPHTPDHDTIEKYMTDTALTVVGICQSPMAVSIEGDSTNIGSGTINLNVYVREDLFDWDYYTDMFISVDAAQCYNTFDDAYNDCIETVMQDLRTLGSELSRGRSEEVYADAQEQISSLEEMISVLQDVGRIQDELDISRIRAIDTLDGVRREIFSGTGGPASDLSSVITDILDTARNTGSGNSVSGLAGRLDKKIEESREVLDSVRNISWILRTREDLAGFESYSSNVGKVSALAKIFPVFFFIVALLVALTTMSRLIEEKRLQIGTLKALGFSNKNILMEYMLFSLLASVAGCILGFSIGFRVFPHAINSAYSMMYILPSMSAPIRWDIAAWVAPVTICSILLAALWACWNEFRSMPAALMLPKAPPAGKRIWLEHIRFIWKKMSFKYKVTFRNLFRYKKRFIMTVIGVAGCSALLLTGFGIKDSVNEIVDKQFGEIYKFDSLFVMDKPSSVNDPDLLEILNDPDMIKSYTLSCQNTGKIYFEKEKQELTVFVPADLNAFPEFITLRSRKTGREHVPDTGVILTEKMCEEMNIRTGDTVTLENSNGLRADVSVSAITENYVSSFAYLTEQTYTELFGVGPEYTSLLCKSAESGISEAERSVHNNTTIPETVSSYSEDTASITEAILQNSHILFGRSVSGLKGTFSDSIQSINGVIYVLILAAGLLCIVVLYNLTNVNICERRKELATLKVLGFFNTETQNYIFRETNILSMIGACAGLLAGIWLHSFVVRTIEVNHIMFGRDIKPLSYIIALGITFIFTILVDLIMKRSISSTDMVEAMKAND